MVDAHGCPPTADLVRVAAARHDAGAHEAGLGRERCGQRVGAEAFGLVLEPGVLEARGGAEVDAGFHCGVLAAEEWAGEGAGADVVFAASEVGPLLGLCEVDVVHLPDAEGDAVVAGLGSGAFGTVGDGVAAGELVELAVVDFVHVFWEAACGALIGSELCDC